MVKELELAAAESVAALVEPGHAAEPSHTHSLCLNCGATLHGRYCHFCGQSTDDHHRSIRHLAWEAVEGFTHLDGRLAKTLPGLLFRPGRLARDHIEGRRARHVPPFRLFLVCLLIFMLAMEWSARVKPGAQTGRATLDTISTPQHVKLKVLGPTGETETEDLGAINIGQATPIGRWLEQRARRAVGDPEYFKLIVFDWAHRLAVLMLPILAGLLTLLYVGKRELYVYDHLVVSMQFLSFVFLLWAVVFLTPEAVNGFVFLAATVWTPANLYLILHGAYGSSRAGAAARALFLWIATCTLFLALLVALLVLALRAM